MRSALVEDIIDAHENSRLKTRIKIAVLDTGYDPQHKYFSVSSRKQRIKGWKDFTGSESREGVDVADDGHGTYVLSLLMALASEADVYVARVTETNEDMKHGTPTVFEAISNVRQAVWSFICVTRVLTEGQGHLLGY